MQFGIRIDHVKNRLYITLPASFSREELHQFGDQVIEAVRRLKPGFTMVTDISVCQPMSVDKVEEVRRVGEFGRRMGMKAAVRVVGVSTITKMQFRRVSREVGYNSYFADSLAAADALLDQELEQAG